MVTGHYPPIPLPTHQPELKQPFTLLPNWRTYLLFYLRVLTFYPPAYLPTDWLTDWLTDWPTDWLTDWPTDWLTDWLTDWPTDRPTHPPTDPPTDWLWLTNWLTDWPTDRQIDWLVPTNPFSYLLTVQATDWYLRTHLPISSVCLPACLPIWYLFIVSNDFNLCLRCTSSLSDHLDSMNDKLNALEIDRITDHLRYCVVTHFSNLSYSPKV